jgi:nucleotide-binding universal stress UspA family protein
VGGIGSDDALPLEAIPVAREVNGSGIAVREEEPMRRPARILVSIDPSHFTATAIDWAVSFAERSRAEVELLYIWDGNGDAVEEDDLAIAFESSSAGIHVNSHVVLGDLVQTTVSVANSEHFDLVVLGLGASEANRHSEAVMAQTVARRSLCPVVTVRGAMLEDDGVPESTYPGAPV